MESKYLSVEEVAKILKIGRPRIYELIKAGKIKSVKPGKRHLVTESELNDYVNSKSRG